MIPNLRRFATADMGSRCKLQESVETKPDVEGICADTECGHGGVSLVLFEDSNHQGQLIATARRWFGQQSIPIEFFVVSSEGTKLAPLSGSGKTTSVRSIDAAVRLSQYDSMAIVDAVYQFNGLHWKVIDPNQKPPAVRSFSFAPTLAPGSRRILAWLYCLVLRLLLRVRKNRITPGFVTFPKELVANLDLHRIDPGTAESPSQMVALAKASGIDVEEHRCSTRQPNTLWTKTNSSGPHFPKSKSLKRSIRTSFQFWFAELAFPSRESASRRAKNTKWNNIATSCAILFVAAILLFANSSHPLFEPDETRNAQLALNIVESGDWISLTLSGKPYWDKPPLLAWLTAISYKCFGVSEWSTRLPSQVSSLFLIAFILLSGTKLLGFRAVAIGSTVLLLAWGFSFQSRYVTMDALLMLFTTMATLGIAVGVEGDNRRDFRARWLLISGTALGLGLLAKGPICMVLTIPPVSLWLFLNRDVKPKAIKAVAKLVAIPAISISAPWFILTTIRNPEFAWYFLWKHHVLRFSDAFNHEEPFWYYVPIVWLFMFPASILLPRVFRVMLSRKDKHRSSRTPTHALLLFSAIWVIGFFSLSQCKLPAYIMPAFPMLALLAGAVFDIDLARQSKSRGRLERLPKRISIGICILSAIAAFLAWHFGGKDTVGKLFSGCIILTSIALALQFPVRRTTSRKKAWLATTAICLMFVLLGVNHLVPSIAKQRSILNTIANSNGGESIPVVYFGRDSFASSIYIPDRKVVHFDEESIVPLERFLSNHQQSSVIASDENIARLQRVLDRNAVIEKSHGRHIWNISFTAERFASGASTEKTR